MKVVCCTRLIQFSCNMPVNRHLACMPALQQVTLDVLKYDETALSKSQSTFPALRSLGLTSMTESSPLDTLSSCDLDKICVTNITNSPTAPTIERLFRALPAGCSHHSVTSIRVTILIRPPAIHILDGFTIDADMMRPLLSFVNLREIDINSYHGFELGNDFLDEVTKAWPKLRRLRLGSRGWGGRSSITLAGFVPLIQRCPDLTYLSLVVDATVVDHCLTIPASNTEIKTLYLGDSKIEDPASVAACLSGLFPNLTSIVSWDQALVISAATPAEEKMYSDRWIEVVRLTKIFADVRQIEESKRDGCGILARP